MRPSRMTVPSLLALSAALVLANVYLLSLNRHLLAQRDSVVRELQRRAELQIGSVVPPLETSDLDGSSVRLSYIGPERATLLLVFSPDCPACDSAWTPWRKAADALAGQGVRVVGLNISDKKSRNDNAEYRRGHDFGPIPFLTISGAVALSAYRLGITPQIILVGRGGIVRGAMTGNRTKTTELASWVNAALTGSVGVVFSGQQ